ncbi:spore coat putative kinase YutH [Bacillus solimangrovi]|uniref:Spore coat protein YutH n=1 Tax=Bacillus solimangrovi TaxID=1305675 RepID=A0A1E5LIV7_9BACI|nr:spore coat protein YutH [Bacillus solimangrovi]OEH93976.1 spore coat protein YutH [Bacillus solimangrovi]
MNVQKLFDFYQIQPEGVQNNRGREEYIYQNQRIFFTSIQVKEEELLEMKMLSDYMYMQGEANVLRIVPSAEQSLVYKEENLSYVLLSAGFIENDMSEPTHGIYLKERHNRGRSYPYSSQHQNRLGKWKDIWATRLQQMEEYWYSKMYDSLSSSFEQWFVESFPYFLGVTENAIQYVADNDLDDVRGERLDGTICMKRIERMVGEIFPWEWIYDHYSRDVGEWIRTLYWEHGYPHCFHEINTFLNDYESRGGLSLYGWRMVYARLLFPQHYFECVEGYFMAHSDVEREKYTHQLRHIIKNNKQYEYFIRDFYQNVGLSPEKLNLPTLHWL